MATTNNDLALERDVQKQAAPSDSKVLWDFNPITKELVERTLMNFSQIERLQYFLPYTYGVLSHARSVYAATLENMAPHNLEEVHGIVSDISSFFQSVPTAGMQPRMRSQYELAISGHIQELARMCGFNAIYEKPLGNNLK